MKKFVLLLSSVVFLILVTGSVNHISADESVDQPIADYGKKKMLLDNYAGLSVVPVKDSKYQIHVQVISRNADGQLIGVTEPTNGAYFPHQITDHVFDTSMGKKKIITIDGIKYEEATFSNSFSAKEMQESSLAKVLVAGLWITTICEQSLLDEITCFNIFQTRTNQLVLEEEDILTTSWTILRELS